MAGAGQSLADLGRSPPAAGRSMAAAGRTSFGEETWTPAAGDP
jgi:hypothetical protein